MPARTQALCPTRTQARRAIAWTPHPAAAGCPCCGTLRISDRRSDAAFTVTELPADPGYGRGRAFRLAKVGTADVYHLFLNTDDPRRSTCDCPGCSYEATARADRRRGEVSESLGCRHLDGMAAVLAAGWLPDPREGPGRDVGPTETPEVDDSWLKECMTAPGPDCPF